MTDMKKWMRVLNESSMPGHVMSEQTCPLCHKMKDMCECWSAPGMMDESTCPMCEQPMDMCECSGSLGIMDEGACPTCHEHPCVCDEGNVVTGALADKSIKVGDKIPGTNLTKTKQIEDESVDPNSDHVSHGYNAALKALDDPMGIMPRNPHVHDHMTPEDEKHAQDWEKGFRAAMHGEGGMDESLTGAAGGAIAGGMMGGPLGAVAGGLLGSNLGNEKESNNSSGPTIVPIPLEEEHCMECGMPMESCTCDEGAGIMHFKDQKAKQAGKKTFALGGRTFPVKEAEDKDQNKDDGKYWDDVEREQSCTRCGGSGGLENRRTGEWQNCSSCGGSGIKSKYRHMEESEQKKKVSETANEEVLEDWNVLYDSAHAKNVRARVRLDKTMDEAAVKEWFSKTFQPMKIYELRRNSVNEETPDSNEEFKPFTLSYRDLRDGKMKRKDFHTERDWNRWYDHPRRSTDNHSYSELEEDGSTIGAPPQATNTATSSDTGAPTTNLSSTSNTPSVPQVAGAIDKDTVQKNAITIPGKQGKWLKVGEDQVEEDREKREEGDNDMTDLLARVHRVLLKKDDENVYLDVKAQIKALTQVAREEDIDLHKLKDAWFENEHGLPMGLSSLNIKNLEPSNPENPMGMGPAAGPAAGLPPMDAGAMAPPPMPAGGPAAAPPPRAPGVPPMQEAKTKQRTGDILANRPKNGVAKVKQGVAEAGPFSYGAKKPRKGSVADLTAKKRKVVSGYAKREIDKKMDAGKFGKTNEEDVGEGYQFKGSFPFDVDHMHGSRGINLPSAPTKKFFTDKKQWSQAVDDINSSKYDDNSEYTSMTGRSTVSIDGHEWARWSDAQQKGYIELSSMTEQGVAEAGPFSYGKPPRKGSIAANAEQKRKEQDNGKQPIEPRDQMVGVAKHGKEYKAVVTGKTASGQEFPTHLKKHYGLGGPKGKLPESAKKAVSESHAVHLEVEDHHEVRMAQADLYKMAKCATELHAMLENMSELEGWVQAKITLAADYVETVKDHIEYEMARKHEEVHADSMMSLAESKKKAKKK